MLINGQSTSTRTLRPRLEAAVANRPAKRKASNNVEVHEHETDRKLAKVRKEADVQDEAANATNVEKNDKVPDATSTGTPTLQITEETGDIFDAPSNALLIHACNCEGSWGAGIAKAFHDRYPAAFAQYSTHCSQHTPDDLVGTAFLIAPMEGAEGGSKRFIGCLFTSRSKGRKKDAPGKILRKTGPAMESLLQHIAKWNAEAADAEKLGEVRMCKINSGLFNVPWAKTKAVLEAIEATADVKTIMVVDWA